MNHLELGSHSTVLERAFSKPESISHRNMQTLVFTRWRLHNAFSLAVGDAIAISLSILAAIGVRYFWVGETLIPVWGWYILPIWIIAATMMRLLPSWGLGPVEELRRITFVLISVYAFTAVALFLNQHAVDTSRLMLMVSLLVSIISVPIFRSLVKDTLCRSNQWGIPVVVYGAGQVGGQVIRLLKRERGLGYNPIGVLDDNAAYWGKRVEGVRVLGDTDMVTPLAPVAILAMPKMSRERQIALLEGPLSNYRKILVIPDLMEAPSLWVHPRDLNGILGLEITSNLTNPISRFSKRLADILMVYVSSPIWLPISLVLTLLIWAEDRHNPFFLQTRIGLNGRVFRTWKFRTMVPNAEEALRKKLEQDPELRREWETTYKLKKDPRITRIGNFLRRSSLDELPQLLNVLLGEMSLVGPRPLPQYHHRCLSQRVRELRDRVRPGVTGLWQVSGRSDIGNDGMEQLDPYYVRNWSVWLDIIVLIRTLRAVVKSSGAY